MPPAITLQRAAALVLLLASVLWWGSAAAQSSHRVVKAGEGIWMISARGGNIGLAIGTDGLLLVDDQFAPLTESLLTTVRQLSAMPLRFVVNTHYHGDHTGGNENLGKTGALIVAHDLVRERMKSEQVREFIGSNSPARPAAALPTLTFSNKVSFWLGGLHIRAEHFPHGHTDGDGVLFFVDRHVVHMGDLYFQSGYPFIDVENGGSIDGLIKAVDAVIGRIDGGTAVIPGHGELSDRRGLIEYVNMLKLLRGRIAAAISARKPLDEIIRARPSADLDSRWGQGFISPDKIVTLIHASLADPRFRR